MKLNRASLFFSQFFACHRGFGVWGFWDSFIRGRGKEVGRRNSMQYFVGGWLA